MTELSPQFRFAEYLSFKIRKGGHLHSPYPIAAESLDLGSLCDKFIYVFAEQPGGAKPWVLLNIYQAIQPPPFAYPRLHPVVGLEPDGAPILGDPTDHLRLPTSISGGIRNRKYYFLALPRMLDDSLVERLERRRPDLLPIAQLTPNGQHFRYLNTTGSKPAYSTQADAGAERLLFIVDPYSVATQLAKTYEWRCDRVVRFAKPEAAYTDRERRITEERLARHALALQIDALRKSGLSFSGQLHENDNSLDQTLQDMDPANPHGALARFMEQREDVASALILLMQSDLWQLLDDDARLTDDRAAAFYGDHLKVSTYCMSRLGESQVGHDFLQELYLKFPPAQAGTRVAPSNAAEVIAKQFVFADEAEPKPDWQEPVVSKAIRDLLSVHTEVAKVMAAVALKRLEDLTSLEPGAALQSWAKGPLRTAMGFTAYRWAYYLRSAYLLERVELNGTTQTVAWFERGKELRSAVLDLSVNWETGEWQARFSNSLNLEGVSRFLTVVGFIFSVGALSEALEKRKNEGIAILNTGSAALSLANDPWVTALFARLDRIAKSGTGLRVARWMGALGAGLGTLASLKEAHNAWVNDGEGDVALAHGASAVGGAIVLWGQVAAAAGVAGPPGWVVIGGYSILLAGPLLAAALKDTPLQRMVDHSFFGTQPGQPHDAPGFAVCKGGKFSAWASSGVESLHRQDRAFSNATWAFGVQGQRMIDSFPLVRLLPQRLVVDSAFQIDVELSWGSPANPHQVSLRSRLWLHVGDEYRLRIEQESGDPLEKVGVPHGGVRLAVLSRNIQSVDGRRRRCFDWIIAPESDHVRQQVSNLDLMHARLELRLSAFGENKDELMLPLPRPGTKHNALHYQLVEPNPSFLPPGEGGQRGQTSASVAVLKVIEVLSLTAYA